MTLSPIHWVPVQDKGSKILCVKLGAMKVTPSDPLHQEYLTINLGSTSDWRQLKLPLVRLFGRWRGRCWPGGAAWGRECRRRSSVLPLNLSDTAATSQDGSSLEFIAAIAGAIFRMQVAEGCGWHIFTQACWKFEDKSHQALFWCVDCFRAVLTLVQLVFGQLFLLVKENLQQLL